MKPAWRLSSHQCCPRWYNKPWLETISFCSSQASRGRAGPMLWAPCRCSALHGCHWATILPGLFHLQVGGVSSKPPKENNKDVANTLQKKKRPRLSSAEENCFLQHQSLRSIYRSCRFVLMDFFRCFATALSEPPLPFPISVIQPCVWQLWQSENPSATAAQGVIPHHNTDAMIAWCQLPCAVIKLNSC